MTIATRTPVETATDLGTTYGTLARLCDEDASTISALLPAREVVSDTWNAMYRTLVAEHGAGEEVPVAALIAWIDSRTAAQYGPDGL